MKKPKTKTHTFWCVVTGDAQPLLFTVAWLKNHSITRYNTTVGNGSSFAVMKDGAGYTCQKFTIKTKIK